MANQNAPQGLRPVLDGSNRAWTGGGNTYYVTSSNPTAMYIGDPVILGGTADANGVPDVVLATAGSSNRITGAIIGFGIVDNNTPPLGGSGYLPASTAGYVIVEDDPNVLFEAQATTVAAVDFGQNTILASGTGNRAQGSQWYVDTGTKGTATYQVRLVRLAQRADNAIGQYAKVLIRLNTPTQAGLATGTGI